jgi:hypothetical protein
MQDHDDYADTEFLYNRVMEPALTAAIGALSLRASERVPRSSRLASSPRDGAGAME